MTKLKSLVLRDHSALSNDAGAKRTMRSFPESVTSVSHRGDASPATRYVVKLRCNTPPLASLSDRVNTASPGC